MAPRGLRRVAAGLSVILTAAAMAPGPPPAVVSPELLPNGRVIFRLRAPLASSVALEGDFWAERNRKDRLTKDADGVWSLTTGPLAADYYSYDFQLDGVPIPDPGNSEIKPGSQATQSAFMVPGAGADYLAAKPVPHGEIRVVYYWSKTVGALRRLHVYLPPGYDGGSHLYPVVYLFHGGGDNDSAWTTIGRANFILDNLTASQKARPMILVMPDLWTTTEKFDAARNEAVFRADLLDDVLPYAEAHYRLAPGVKNRAVGGLGIGRPMLPDVLWSMMDRFGSAFFASGGTNAAGFAALNKAHPGAVENPATIRQLRFFMGDGAHDGSLMDSIYLGSQMKKLGYQVTSYQSDGSHGWPAFRRAFLAFARTAFKG